MARVTRRELLQRGAWALGGGLLGLEALGTPAVHAGSTQKGFSFVLYTDVHVEPELHATEGFAKAVHVMKTAAPDAAFAICGGDLVFDAMAVPPARASLLYDLYQKDLKTLGLPVHHTIGNHDLFGIDPKSGVPASDPQYGKALFLERTGQTQTYSSFDYGGWHFVILDSVQPVDDGVWRGFVDAAQLAWLAADLKKAGKKTPTIVVTHVPLITAGALLKPEATPHSLNKLIVENGKDVQALFQGHNVKAVLQGHTHIVEDNAVSGTRYISCGAVCGDWWKGWRLGIFPEGFMVCHATPTGAFTTRYVPYGWVADQAPT